MSCKLLFIQHFAWCRWRELLPVSNARTKRDYRTVLFRCQRWRWFGLPYALLCTVSRAHWLVKWFVRNCRGETIFWLHWKTVHIYYSIIIKPKWKKYSWLGRNHQFLLPTNKRIDASINNFAKCKLLGKRKVEENIMQIDDDRWIYMWKKNM